MSECCYFCPETECLEKHHIVPKRYGGNDTQENQVSVCPTCHSKLERLYDDEFYRELGVSKEDKDRDNLPFDHFDMKVVEQLQAGKVYKGPALKNSYKKFTRIQDNDKAIERARQLVRTEYFEEVGISSYKFEGVSND